LKCSRLNWNHSWDSRSGPGNVWRLLLYCRWNYPVEHEQTVPKRCDLGFDVVQAAVVGDVCHHHLLAYVFGVCHNVEARTNKHLTELEGDTIILNNPRTLGFIACPTSNANYYTLYLQEGNDKPSSSCSTVDLHLPCLC
jgi:hypothetical protein